MNKVIQELRSHGKEDVVIIGLVSFSVFVICLYMFVPNPNLSFILKTQTQTCSQLLDDIVNYNSSFADTIILQEWNDKGCILEQVKYSP